MSSDTIFIPQSPLMNPWDLMEKAMKDHAHLETLNFSLPILRKGLGNDGRRWHQGVASTPDMDLQKEIAVQKGIDFRYFLAHGFFNDDHKKGNQNKVGQPTVAVIKQVKNAIGKNVLGLWVEGFCWKAGTHAGADAIWELTKAMEASQSNRKMAYSLEGKTLVRSNGKLLKTWVQDVAITASPINPMSWMEIAPYLGKSFNTPQETMTLCKSFKIDPDVFDDTPCRDLGEPEETEKAFAVGGGSPMVPQSLAGTRKETFRQEDELSKSLRFCHREFLKRGHNEHVSWQLAQAAVARTILQ